MNEGFGEQWLITFTETLHKKINNLVLSHAPLACYFKEELYTNKGYAKVNKEVGDLIDFYNIQYYDQLNNNVEHFESLDSGKMFKNLVSIGVEKDKILRSIAPINQNGNKVYDLIPCSKYVIQYPIRLGYINNVASWWPPSDVLEGMGVPGYAKNNDYNFLVLSFWGCDGSMDMVKVWENPVTYLGSETGLGTTKEEVQKNLKKKYNDGGVKLMISAFGGEYHPTNIHNE